MAFQVMGGKTPGPLGITAVSGLSAGLHLPQFFANIATKAAREVGKDILKLALKRAGTRIAGKILIKSKAWGKAFLHIAEHFSVEPLLKKGTHTLFKAPLRNRAAVEALIVKAVKNPSRKIVSRATVHGVRAGRPVIIIEREFTEVIGETFKQAVGEEAKKIADCKILRVIVDITGRPITAYPVEAFEVILAL